MAEEHFETVIVGAGQAGLAIGYHLAAGQRPFLIVDANQRIGDSWRNRWESLRLLTPAQLNGLPGYPFPAPSSSHVSKDEVADYLETYAKRFDLPVRNRVRVDGLHRDGERFVVSTADTAFEADNVVVATGPYQRPRVPSFASQLDPAIVQLHSREYRDASQLPEGDVLVVGAGESGTSIAMELSRTHPTWLSGEYPALEPTHPGTVPDRIVTPIMWFLGSHVLTVRNPIGRKLRPKILATTAPLAWVKPKDIQAADIEKLPRTIGVRNGRPQIQDGRIAEVSSVIWCTGYDTDFEWIDLPVFDNQGQPNHYRGVVDQEPGLYFVGLLFLSALTSSLIGGVGRDAEYIAGHIAARAKRQQPSVNEQ
jgi:putative flavoprotein involved in K+ transport